MADGKNKFKLFKEIINLSESKEWDSAKHEWEVTDISHLSEWEEFESCLCWQYPIKEVCYLTNIKNWNRTIVWNVCVNKFLDLDININKVFQVIKKLKNDNSSSLNEEAIKYFFEKNIITKKDKDFYLNIWRKKKLSDNQKKWKLDINRKVLRSLSK